MQAYYPYSVHQYMSNAVLTESQRHQAHHRAELARMEEEAAGEPEHTHEPDRTRRDARAAKEAELLRARNVIAAGRYGGAV